MVTTDGRLLTFGWGSSGALGHGSRHYQLRPAAVEALGGHRVGETAAGAQMTLALEHSPGSAALAGAMRRLLESKADADVAVVCGLTPFALHRVVLEARAPRLLAMLAFNSRFGAPPPPAAERPPLREALPSDLALPPLRLRRVRAAVFELLVRWLYTGELPIVTDALFRIELAALARRLRIPALERLARVRLETPPPASARGLDDGGAAPLPAAAASEAESLGGQLLSVLRSGSFAELRLKASDGAVDAHRAILCARSEYFAQLLHGHFREADGAAELDLSGYGVGVAELRALLTFVYSGALRGAQPPELMLALLRVGAALLMDDLRVLCSARLAEVVDADNADALEAEAEAAFAPRLSAACRRAKRAAS